MEWVLGDLGCKIAIGGVYTPRYQCSKVAYMQPSCSYVVKKKKKINLVLVCEEKKRVEKKKERVLSIILLGNLCYVIGLYVKIM